MQVNAHVMQHIEIGAGIARGDIFDPEHRLGRRRLFRVLDRADGYQRLGICLARVVDDPVSGAIFDHFAHFQDHDVVRHLRHHRQVVRDVKRGNAGFTNGLLDCHQHVDLGGHIERRGRFVKHHQIGFGAERQRRHAALQLPARHLMRIAAADMFGVRQPQPVKQIDRAGLGLAA